MGYMINGIRIYSEMNAWIDFIVVPVTKTCDEVKDRVEEIYYEYFDDDTDETVSAYLIRRLHDEGITVDVFWVEPNKWTQLETEDETTSLSRKKLNFDD